MRRSKFVSAHWTKKFKIVQKTNSSVKLRSVQMANKSKTANALRNKRKNARRKNSFAQLMKKGPKPANVENSKMQLNQRQSSPQVKRKLILASTQASTFLRQAMKSSTNSERFHHEEKA